jgi:hypothetical protein
MSTPANSHATIRLAAIEETVNARKLKSLMTFSSFHQNKQSLLRWKALNKMLLSHPSMHQMNTPSNSHTTIRPATIEDTIND